MCDEELQNGQLVRVLAEYEKSAQSAYLLYPHRLHLSAKVRAFVDLAIDYFQTGQHKL